MTNNRTVRRVILVIGALVVSLLAIWVGVLADAQRMAVAEILSVPAGTSSPNVEYAHQFDASGAPMEKPESFSRGWLRYMIGEHVYRRPIGVSWDGAKATDEDLAKLHAFPSLKRLDLEYSMITDEGLKVVCNFNELERLDLQETFVTDNGLRQIAGLTNLRTLLLAGKQFTDAGLAHLRNLRNLEHVSVRFSSVTGKGLAHFGELPRLRSLWLGHSSQLGDSAIKHLAKLNGLEELELKGTGITDDGIAELQKALPNCQIKWK